MSIPLLVSTLFLLACLKLLKPKLSKLARPRKFCSFQVLSDEIKLSKWLQIKIQALEKLYDEIRLAIESEWDLIYAVFPNAHIVIQVFVQRIFAQSVRPLTATKSHLTSRFKIFLKC